MKEIKWNSKARNFIKLLDDGVKREIGTSTYDASNGVQFG